MKLVGTVIVSFSLLSASAVRATTLTNCAEIAAFASRDRNECACVRLTGQILSARYCTRPPHPNCEAYYFFADKTGSVPLRASSLKLYQVGDVIDVKGSLTFQRGMSYSIVGNDISVIGHETPPRPIPTDLAHIKAGKYPYRLVSVSGLVIDAFEDEIDSNYFWLVLCQNGTTLPVAMPAQGTDAAEVFELVGCEIAMEGGVYPDSSGRRFLPVHLETSRSNIAIIRQNTSDRFNAPLLKETGSFAPLHRYCLIGSVLATFGNGQMFIQSQDGTPIEVRLSRGVSPPPCDAHVRVSGILDSDLFFVSLIQAVWRDEPGHASLPPVIDVTPRELLTSSSGQPQINARYHGRIIRMTGSLTQAAIRRPGKDIVHLECSGIIVPIDLSAVPDKMNSYPPGTLLSIVGVCRLEQEASRLTSEMPHIRGFSIIPRRDSDITVLRTPPWWTSFRLLIVIGILFALLVTVFLWNITLRLIAERRGRELFRENVARISADLRTEERTRLAVDLHDSLAQMLTGVSFQIDAGELENASKSLKSCRDELRNCLWDLRHQMLEQKDMNEAIRRTLKPHIGNVILVVRFNAPRDRLSDLTAHSVLMIIRELATNAVRHGHAKTLRIAGGIDGDRLLFSVRDDGTGFDPDNHLGLADGHFGLQGIRERVKRCDGTVAFDSAPGKGTKVTISLKRQK